MRLTVDAGPLPALPAAVEVAAYRITTEAVTNVVRHSGATECLVSVEHHPGVLRLTVHDNGCGLSSPAAPSGNGLQTMRERAEELRGRPRIGWLVGEGTTLVAELPAVAANSPSVQAGGRP